MATNGDLSTIKGLYSALADNANDANQKKKFEACRDLCDDPLIQGGYKVEDSGLTVELYDLAYMSWIGSHAKA